MPDNDETTSAAIETYLRRIIDDDIDKKSGICLSSFYTELPAELSVDDILPFKLRVIEKDEDRQQEYEILELVGKEKNLIISGITGSGKTTSLRWLNVIYANKFLEEKNGWIPVFIELNTYVRGTFYDHVRICLSEKGVDTSSFKSMLSRNLLFLIDGLDLLSPSESFPAYDEVLNFISEYSGCKYVISSRPGFFERFRSRFQVSEFEELNETNIKLFINKFVQDKKFSESLYNRIQSNEKLASLFRNPLMLSLGISVEDIRRNDNNEIIQAGLPDCQSEMYDAFIDHLFNHLDKKGKTLNANYVLIKETLADIYFSMQCRNRVSCKYAQALEIAEKHLKINKLKFKKTSTAEDILRDIFSLGLLNYNRNDFSVKYGVHQSFQEYFAALKLKDCFDKNKMDISQAFRHPRWENIVILSTEMFDTQDEFISSIISCGNLSLASKCIKKASLHIKEELCFKLAEGLDTKFLSEKINSVESIARLGDVGISLLIDALRDKNKNVRSSAADAIGSIKSEESVDILIDALHDENDDVRISAADALGSIKSEKSIDHLFATLQDENDDVRSHVADALGSIDSEKSIAMLIAALRDENDGVRRCAANAFGNIESEKAEDQTIAMLREEKDNVYRCAADAIGSMKLIKEFDQLFAVLHDENDDVRSRAADALIGRMKSEKAVDQLIDALRDEDNFMRSSAAYVLGIIKSEKSIDALIDALHDKDGNVCWRAADALGSIKSEKSVDMLIAALNDKDGNVRISAVDALGSIKSEKSVDALIVVLREENENDDVRKRAAYALGIIKSEKSVDALIDALSDNDRNVRGRAAYVLGIIKSEKSVDALIAVLCDKDDVNVRISAMDALGSIKSEKSVDMLIDALHDENYNVRNSAAAALGNIKSEKSLDALIAVLREENEDVRSSAAYALGNIKSAKSVDMLIDALHDKEGNVRRRAAYVLGIIKSEKSVDALIAVLCDKDVNVRISAVDALGSIKSEKSVEALIAVLRDDNYNVNSRASNALIKICKDRHKDVLKKLKDSNNEHQANACFNILNQNIMKTQKKKYSG